jgi:hypothetical protein
MSEEFLDLDGVDPNNLDDRLSEGRYQFLIQSHSVDDKGTNTLAAEVVAAKDQRMLGKIHNFKFWKAKPHNGDPEQIKKNQNAARIQAKFLMASGAVKKEDLLAAKSGGGKVAIDWSKCVGGFFFSELKKDGKGYLNPSFGSYFTDTDPEVANNAASWPAPVPMQVRAEMAARVAAANAEIDF